MGLDQYLKVRKNEYQSKWRNNMTQYPAEIAAVTKGLSDSDESISINTDYNVGYWRKANAVHQWFVDNCAEGVDDCRPIYVSKEQLQELHTICLQILVDPKKGEELLPTADGFFFGSTEYDEGYMDDIKYTAELLNRVLKLLEEHDEYEVIYQASW